MHPDDELAGLRHLLDALESGSMKLLLNGRDVTQEEVAKLKPDIEYLESVLARIRSSRKSHA
jgi:ribosomal protein L7Ae-like RNA K-turn-binding protein